MTELQKKRKLCEEYKALMDDARRYGYGGWNSPETYIDIINKLEVLGREWGDSSMINGYQEFRLLKGIAGLVNTGTYFAGDKNKYYIHWRNKIGPYLFVSGSNTYNAVRDEYNEFVNKLMQYNPLDYDLINDHIVYDIENGKKVMADYPSIIKETEEKMRKKLRAVKLERAKAEYEKLLAESEETES